VLLVDGHLERVQAAKAKFVSVAIVAASLQDGTNLAVVLASRLWQSAGVGSALSSCWMVAIARFAATGSSQRRSAIRPT